LLTPVCRFLERVFTRISEGKGSAEPRLHRLGEGHLARGGRALQDQQRRVVPRPPTSVALAAELLLSVDVRVLRPREGESARGVGRAGQLLPGGQVRPARLCPRRDDADKGEPLAGEVRCLEQRLLSPHLATSRAISDESLVVSRANLAPISRQSRAIPPRVERRLHPHRHRRHHRRVEGRVGEVGARPRRVEEEGAWRVLARRGEASYWLRSGGRREAEPECSSRREGGLLTTAARAAGGDRRSQSRRRRRPTRSRSAGRRS
jgi:hypothetical protein